MLGNGGGGQSKTIDPTTLHLLGLQLLCHPTKTVSISLTFPSLPQLVG